MNFNQQPPRTLRVALLVILAALLLHAFANEARGQSPPPTTQYSYPTTQFSVYGATYFPPPTFPTTNVSDTSTLAGAPWFGGRTRFDGTPGTEYVVAKSWGVVPSAGFTLDLHGATLRFTGPPGRLFAGSNIDFGDGRVILGRPEDNRGLVRFVNNATFHDLIIEGGGDVFVGDSGGTRNLTLRNIWQAGAYRGNWLYADPGGPSGTGVHENWSLQNLFVDASIREDLGGISHVMRVYKLKNAWGSNLLFRNFQASGGMGAAERIHNTAGGFSTFDHCTFDGYEQYVGPLDHPGDMTTCDDVTFRACDFRNHLQIMSGANRLLFDTCLFDANGTTRPISCNNTGDVKDAKGNPLKGWPTVTLRDCVVRTTAQSGKMIDVADPTRFTISGGRATNPSKGYDGPLRLVVP
jgi:hypothetical protein